MAGNTPYLQKKGLGKQSVMTVEQKKQLFERCASTVACYKEMSQSQLRDIALIAHELLAESHSGGYRVGDQVRFVGKDRGHGRSRRTIKRWKRGTITKMNQKTASVNIDGFVWRVPFPKLHKEENFPKADIPTPISKAQNEPTMDFMTELRGL